jgi:hypothetical protein
LSPYRKILLYSNPPVIVLGALFAAPHKVLNHPKRNVFNELGYAELDKAPKLTIVYKW